MLVLRALVEDMGLRVLAGARGLDRPVRWVHISELADPTPFLSGGELLLTHGEACDAAGYIGRLARHGVAGLGVAVGEDGLADAPSTLLADADAAGFPVVEIPDAVPFIAITERAATTIVNAQAAALARASEAHARLEGVVLAGGGLDGICAALADIVGSGVAVLDAAGRTRAVAGGVGQVSEVLRLPITRPGVVEPEAWLEADGPLTEVDRLVLQHAVTVVGLELMARRVAAETEHRLAGDVLASVLAGDLAGDELVRRLEPFGLGASLAAVVAVGDEAVAGALAEAVRARGTGLVAATGGHACALIPGEEDAEAVRARAERALGSSLFVGVSRPTPSTDARRAFHEARCALDATARRNGDRPRMSTFDDLGSFRLLLSMQDGDALKLFCDSILAPLEAADEGYGGELHRSLAAFIECNGSWERAARQLDVHRHTLRYRVKRIEELTGRSLDVAGDRIDFWLALRGRELVSR